LVIEQYVVSRTSESLPVVPSKVAPPDALPLGLLALEDFVVALAGTPKRPLIGIDVGTKTLGLALSDVTLMIASSLETIRRVKFTPDAARLIEIAAKFEVCGFVLGLPVNLDGTEGPRAQATRAFVRNLTKLTPLPMLFWDERWSTVAAERSLIEADASRKRRAEVIDQVAATIILQGALDRMRELRRTSSAPSE
jgi:putative holliday junction resolvase